MPWLPRPALLAQVRGVIEAGGVVVLAAEPGTGKSVLVRQVLDLRAAGGRVVTVDGALPATLPPALQRLASWEAGAVVVDRSERLGDDALLRLGAATAERAEGVGMLVVGRTEPSAALRDLLAGDRVLVLDGEDLAWTPDEVAAALRLWGPEGAPVTEVELHALWWQTEGWCAAVRLAAEGVDLASWGRALVAGVRGALPPDRAEGVLALAQAEQVDAQLVDDVLAPPEGGAAYLDWLVRRRLFVRRVVPGEPALRFLRPFAAAARQALDGPPEGDADRLRLRMTRAARDRGAEGLVTATPGAELLDDDLLAASAVDLLLAGRLSVPPTAVLAASAGATPEGRTAAAVALLAAGDAEVAGVVLAAGDPRAPAGSELRLVHDALQARRAADLAATAAYAARFVRERAREELQAFGWLQLGTLELDLGWYDAARHHLRLAAGHAERMTADAVVAAARAGLAHLAALSSRIVEAERLATAAADATVPAVRARVLLARAHCAFLRQDLPRARATAEQAGAPLTQGGLRDPYLWFAVLLHEVSVLEALGADDLAAERLAEAHAAHERCPRRPFHARLLDIYEARLLDHAGRADEAGRVLDRLAVEQHPALDLVLARRALAAGDTDGAMAALRPALRDAAGGASGLDVWRLVTYAITCARRHDAAAAHAALERALALAVPEGLRRPFADEALRLEPLLRTHVAAGSAYAAFIEDLLPQLAQARPAPEGRLRAPLTARERVVLDQLSTDRTAAEIADVLLVSEATVRTHVRHIYDKLGVSSRRAAVSRARDLRIVDPVGR